MIMKQQRMKVRRVGQYRIFSVHGSACAQHLLNMLAAVLVRRFEVHQPLIEFVDIGLEVFGLEFQLLPQRWQGRQCKPADC